MIDMTDGCEMRLSARAEALRADWADAQGALQCFRGMRLARDEARQATKTLLMVMAEYNPERFQKMLRTHVAEWPWLGQWIEEANP